jgi:hypothetical protein
MKKGEKEEQKKGIIKIWDRRVLEETIKWQI